jgi:hypothetical protein
VHIPFSLQGHHVERPAPDHPESVSDERRRAARHRRDGLPCLADHGGAGGDAAIRMGPECGARALGLPASPQCLPAPTGHLHRAACRPCC